MLTTRSTRSSPSLRWAISNTVWLRAAEKTSSMRSLAVARSRPAVWLIEDQHRGAGEQRPAEGDPLYPVRVRRHPP